MPHAPLPGLLRDMARTASQGRALGTAFDVLVRMYTDPDAVVMVGLAGSLGSAGQWPLVSWMIRHGFVDILVATGATLSEDLIHCLGYPYVQRVERDTDERLFEAGLNRYYDTLGAEAGYEAVIGLIGEYYRTLKPGQRYGSRPLLEAFGHWIDRARLAGDPIVVAAAESGVPVYVPGIVDSAYGDAALLGLRDGHEVVIDEVADFAEFASLAPRIARSGAFVLGGGVPKDFIQTFAATSDLLGDAVPGRVRQPVVRAGLAYGSYPHAYSVQVTADSEVWGGSSGARPEEGVSWGKRRADGVSADCRCDLTIALPLLTHGLAAELGERSRQDVAALLR